MSRHGAGTFARTMMRSASSSGTRCCAAPSTSLRLLATRSPHRTASTSSKAPTPTPQAEASTSSNDHRSIGKSQSLFLTHDSSPGTPFILPHGMRLARKVERVVRDLYDVYGYDEVQSPQLYKTSLWKRSGHWDNYRDDMFATEGYKERLARTQSASTPIPIPIPIPLESEPSSVDEARTACCSIHPPPRITRRSGRRRELWAETNELSWSLLDLRLARTIVSRPPHSLCRVLTSPSQRSFWRAHRIDPRAAIPPR